MHVEESCVRSIAMIVWGVTATTESGEPIALTGRDAEAVRALVSRLGKLGHAPTSEDVADEVGRALGSAGT